MKTDFLNISIIREFYNLKEKEMVELAKIRDRIFPNLSKVEKNKKLGLIRDRLQAMPQDLFRIEHKKFWNYNLITENVSFKKFDFPDGKKDGIAVRIKSRWQINEL